MFYAHLCRTWNNTYKKLFLTVILLLPSLEVFQLLWQYQGIEPEKTVYAMFFLSGAGRGHLFQVLYLWLLPLYLLILFADDSCIDGASGYKYILMSRIGVMHYRKEKWFSAFLQGFLIMLCSLLLNMLAVYLILRNRCSNAYLSDFMLGTTFEQWYRIHPMLSYVMYVLLASLISGMLAMLCAALSTAFENRRYVYMTACLIWLLFIVSRDSIMLILQPFIEYPAKDLVRILTKYVLACAVILIGSAIYERKKVCQ